MDFSAFLSSPTGIVAAGGVAFLVGWLVIGMDNRVEDRRKKAIEVAGKLRGAGFTRLPAFFEDYAVGDISGMIKELKSLHDVLSDPVQRAAELDKVLKLLLTDIFRDPERRPALLKFIEDLKAANLPDAKSVIRDEIGEIATQRTFLDDLKSGPLGKFIELLKPPAEPATGDTKPAA